MTTAAIQFDRFCLSSFLTFRYVVSVYAEWLPGVRPWWPSFESAECLSVRDATETLAALRSLVDQALKREPVGLLLSGGIDSAILAALLPRGTPAYTVRYDAQQSVDESRTAARYARRCGLRHRVVTVTWPDYEERAGGLMRHKRAPLHPVEVGLSLAASMAAADGVKTLIVGNGADSTFGGLDRLLSRDWTLDEFVKRYTFFEPSEALCDPLSLRPAFEEYLRGRNVDVSRFLKEVHGPGIIQAFENAIHIAGCKCLAPYESLVLAAPLDLARIRTGEPKYILREIFGQLYPGLPVVKKTTFTRPMDSWMKNWTGPQRAEFKRGLDLSCYDGEQKWQLYSLERFMNLLEAE